MSQMSQMSQTCLLITLIKCLKGHKSLGSLGSVVKGLIVSSVGRTDQRTKGQGQLLSCSGQLKMIVKALLCKPWSDLSLSKQNIS